MFCNRCGKEIKDGEQFCEECKSKNEEANLEKDKSTNEKFNMQQKETDNSIKGEKKKKKKSKNIIILTIIFVILCVIAFAVFYFMKDKNGSGNDSEDIKQIGSSGQVAVAPELSFANMKIDNSDLNLDDTQREILKYFDNDYFYISTFNYEDLQRYPDVYKGAQVNTDCIILKVLKSTDEEFEALATFYDGFGEPPTLADSTELFVFKSEQLNERLIETDNISLYGRYINIDTYNVDGKSYTIPTINATNIVHSFPTHRFSLETITTVAKYIFGNDIKISEPVSGTDFDLGPHYSPQDWFYLVKLDNQSNANFKAFDMHMDYGYIGYNYKHNGLPDTIEKRLFISADFQHFIVSTYDSGTKHVYIDYFDRQLKKLWGREFDYESEAIVSPMDYTSTQMAFVIDNDLYLVDLQTGENIIDPVLVGNKVKVMMLSDGILLVGNSNKDAIMKVGYDGQILQKMNANTKMQQISTVSTQIVDGKMVIVLEGSSTLGEGTSVSYQILSKYIVLNADGTVKMSTDDRVQYAY